MNDFLAALQAKANQINQSIKAKVDKPIQGGTYALTGNNGNNIASGRSWADSEVKQPEPKRDDHLVVTVDVVTNRNRLDVFFNRKPEQIVLDQLHKHGFRFRPSDKGWFHQDNPSNRQFLADAFNASFGDDELPVTPETIEINTIVNDAEPDLVTATGSTEAREPKEIDVDFERYKNQVDELCERLNMHPSDLAVYAIEQLYSRLNFIN